MANYPRTEEQMVKRMQRAMQRNIARNTRKMKLMHRCEDRDSLITLSDIPSRDLCDVSRGETPDSVRNREPDMNSKEERENFRKELDYANRLNRVEDYTGLTISGNEDAKREVLDGGFERALVKASRLFDVSREQLEEIRIGGIGEGVSGEYDSGEKAIFFSDKKSVDSSTVYHEFAHAEIHGWGKFDKVREIGSDDRGLCYTRYVELCADVIATEKVGTNRETKEISSRSVKSSEEIDGDLNVHSMRRNNMNSFDEVCFDRAHAQIYGNHETLNLIDSKLKSDYNIDVFGGNGIGEKIANVTNMFVENAFLDGRDKLKNFEKIGQSVYDLKNTKFDPPD